MDQLLKLGPILQNLSKGTACLVMIRTQHQCQPIVKFGVYLQNWQPKCSERQKFLLHTRGLILINFFDTDIMELKRMMEKLGQAKTHLELKKMIAEVDTNNSGGLCIEI